MFGMRTGVPPPTKHQHRELKVLCTHLYEEENKKTRALRDSHNSFQEFCRGISTPRLNTLLCFHLAPINVVISHGPQRFLILGFVSRLDAFSGYQFPT